MSLLIIGLILFLGVHSIAIFAPGFRDSARARLGDGAWKGLYSVASLAGLILICKGFALARLAPVVIYSPANWLRYVAVVVMLPVFPLLFAAYLPGRIRTAARQPMLAGVKFWCLAHLLANGMLADILLFGGFLAWAVADRIVLKRRPPQSLRTLPERPWNDAAAVVVGLAVYALLIAGAHRWLFGVAPLG
ncbi:MAG: NnrU family protein [Steroidobacterales bacterium]